MILGACNPPLARRALSADLRIGLLLPCNIIVCGDGASTVEFMDSQAALAVVDVNPEIASVPGEAKARLQAVAHAIQDAPH